ncbi:hypothetical protein PABG_00355 [Paracoccidioides brasiliensis Pb03]|nr:hypothetical protein PABG_00355 [Paracoccidioides brasiliensis Pb03]
MRPLISLLVLPFSAITGVVAYDARAYTFDPQQLPVPPVNRVVSPETARLILISRLGLSECSTLGSVDETVIRDLNTFGGKQTPIMEDAMSDGDYSKLLLVWEGVDIPDLASASKYSSNSFTIPTAPNDLVDGSFIKKLLAQSSTVRTTSKLCPFDFDVEGGFRGSLILYTSQCPSGNNLFPSGTSRFSETAFLKFLARGARSWGGEHTTAILRISSGSNTPAVRKTVFSTLAELSILAKESRQESTMIFADTVPPYRTANRPYKERERSILEPRQPKDANDMTRGHKFPSAMMPFCYNDNRTCTEATNSCSGHGSCYRKFGSKEGSKGDCYACKCGRTVVRTNQDGSVKTVQWGGPACQKKDVSIPFYSIAGISILVVFSIAGGIRMLFSVGMEELPSVLGAGVAVPKSQK